MTAGPGRSDAVLERLLREEWGRLLALLAARFRRLDLAEDGLADAFEAAARSWPADGVPGNPQGWLMTTARRRILDRMRAEAVAARKLPLLLVDAELGGRLQQDQELPEPGRAGPADERLRLVLLCAHPKLSAEAAAALTLRLVLGLSCADIARLFLQQTSTMAARLTRAKHKIAGERFSVPTGAELAGRVGTVCDVGYLAFTAGYAPGSGEDLIRADLAGEAIRLIRVLRSVLPDGYDTDEVDALLALMLLQHSRRDARTDAGDLVLLADQDRRRWHQGEIAEAIALLTPLVAAPPSRYLLQALIAAEHAIAPHPRQTAWPRIVQRYDELLQIADSPVVRLNRAVAVAEVDGPRAGLAELATLAMPGHRLPAARAELFHRCGESEQALHCYDAAIVLCGNAAERRHLERRRAEAVRRSGRI